MDRTTQQNEQRRRIIDFPASAKRIGSADGQAHDFPPVFGPDAADDWSYEVVAVKQVGTYIVVTASLSTEGRFRDGLGICHVDEEEAINIAERRALQDAAAKFAAGSVSRAVRPGGSRPGRRTYERIERPEAGSIADLVTYSQLSEARMLAGRLGLSADDEAERLFGCLLSELSRTAADRLIESLESYAPQARKLMQAG